MRAIELSPRTHIDVPGLLANELQAGACVQMWVRPIVLPNAAVLFELGQLRLVLHAGGALELRSAAEAITAPGAISTGRWTLVAIEIAEDGTATLLVDGFRATSGRLPQLGDSAHMRIGDATVESSLAIADVRLFAQQLLAHYCGELDGEVLRDAGPLGRHARVHGAARAVTTHDPDALAVARPGSLVWDKHDCWLEMPALTSDFTRGITIEGWIRPRSMREQMNVIEFGADADHVRLWVDPVNQLLSFEYSGTRSKQEARLPGVLRADAWQHVCVAVDGKGMCRVFVDARLVHERQLEPPAPARQGARTRCTIGRRFLGEMAELRVWQGERSIAQVQQLWLRRARGDEERLVACYRLDTVAEGLAYDVSPHRQHARPNGMVASGDALGLPLRACNDSTRVHVRTAGKLLLDELPVSLFPRDTSSGGGAWGMPDIEIPDELQPVKSASKYGTVHGNLVRCAVYEIGIEPRAGDGSKLAGEVEVRVDAEVTVVRSDGSKQRVEVWKPGRAQRLAVSDSGRARVRVLASSLDCPSLRIRAASMDEDCWAVVRPADVAHQQLRSVSGSALERPPAGKKPVLKPDTPNDDAEAIAQFMRDVAWAVPLPHQLNHKGSVDKGLFDPLEEFGRTVGNAIVDLGGDVAKLTIAAAEEAEKLAKKAAGTAMRTGTAAIRSCIQDARSLAIDRSSPVWGGITVVGEIIVDGSKQAFRTVVAGVRDVVEAIDAFLRRIGAKIRDFIEFLAMLFDWPKIVEKSDDLYRLALDELDGMHARAEDLRRTPALLDELVAMPRGSSLAGKSIGQAFGVDPRAELPDFEQLKYLVDVIEEAFSSSPPKLDKDPKAMQGPTHLDESETKAASEATVATLPSELLAWPGDVLDIPMDVFLDLPQQTWDAGRSVVTSMSDWVGDHTDDLLERAREMMTSRFDVPYLTEMIELVILGGRKLNLLRLVALLGAVPAVLDDGRSHKSTSTSTNKSTNEAKSEKAEDIRWAQFGCSVFNSSFFVARSVCEWINQTESMLVFTGLSGASSCVLAALDLTLADQYATGDARALGLTHGVLALFGGVWMVGSTVWAAFGADDVVRASVDAVVEAVLGVGELTTAIVLFTRGDGEQQEFWSDMGMRLGNWVLRGAYRILDGMDNTKFPATNVLTTGCAVAILLVDLGDMGWTTAGYAMS